MGIILRKSATGLAQNAMGDPVVGLEVIEATRPLW